MQVFVAGLLLVIPFAVIAYLMIRAYAKGQPAWGYALLIPFIVFAWGAAVNFLFGW